MCVQLHACPHGENINFSSTIVVLLAMAPGGSVPNNKRRHRIKNDTYRIRPFANRLRHLLPRRRFLRRQGPFPIGCLGRLFNPNIKCHITSMCLSGWCVNGSDLACAAGVVPTQPMHDWDDPCHSSPAVAPRLGSARVLRRGPRRNMCTKHINNHLAPTRTRPSTST